MCHHSVTKKRIKIGLTMLFYNYFCFFLPARVEEFGSNHVIYTYSLVTEKK